MSSRAPSRPNSSMVCTASAGRPGSASAPWITLDEHAVGVQRRRSAAQHDRVAALERERGDVDGHVRAGLVDRADHAERHAHLGQLQAVGQDGSAHDLARPGRAAPRSRAPPPRAPARRAASRRSRSCRPSLKPFSRPLARSSSFAGRMRRTSCASTASAIAWSARILLRRYVARARAPRSASRAAASLSISVTA